MSELTLEQMKQIMADRLLGRSPSVTGPEADTFRESFEKTVQKAKDNGGTVEIPAEWEV
jgi:hypothetical protein